MRFWLALCALFFTLTASRADDTYQTYQNARFGYSVVYPSNFLVPQPEADNGDGRKFRSRDGRITLTVYGVNNALSRTHTQEFNRARAAWKTDGARTTLTKIAPQYFALSGFIDNDIFYEKTVFYGDTFCTMIWEYPQEMRQRLDGAVTRSFGSFSPTIWSRSSSTSAPVQKPKHPVAVKPTRPTPLQRTVATPKPQQPVARSKPIVRPQPVVRSKPTPRTKTTTPVGVGVDAGVTGGY